jgi:hypothetical protein
MSDDYRWGVAYEFDALGEPLYVEEADDERDAYAWAEASGDPAAKVMRQRIGHVVDGLWTVQS